MTLALIVSSYHDTVTTRLEAGARARAREAGLADADITTFTVPADAALAMAALYAQVDRRPETARA